MRMCAMERRDEAGVQSPVAGEHAFVVPVFGCSPFLEDCLRSLVTQTLSSRVVITTSTPSDFLDAVAGRFGVPVIVNPLREGIAEDWNFALCVTDARYVTLAHQDDVYDPSFLERTLVSFSRQVGALCFTGYREVDDEGRTSSSKISRIKHLITAATIGSRPRPPRWRLRAFLSLGNPLPCSSVTLDRRRLPDFRFSTGYASNLDWDAWLRLLDQRVRFLFVPERLVGRRHNRLTATAGLIADGRRRSEDLTMFRRIWPHRLGTAIAFIYRLGY